MSVLYLSAELNNCALIPQVILNFTVYIFPQFFPWDLLKFCLFPCITYKIYCIFYLLWCGKCRTCMYIKKRIHRDFSKKKGSRVGWEKVSWGMSENTVFGFTGWRGREFNWYIIKLDPAQYLNRYRCAKSEIRFWCF